jgi:hypothetical protein
MPSEKHDQLELTSVQRRSPRFKWALALSGMAGLAIVTVGSLPISDAKAGWSNGGWYNRTSSSGQQYRDYGPHYDYNKR